MDVSYWVTCVALIVFGFLTGFSIGQPFLLVGAAMLILGPVHHRAKLFWPPFAAVIAYDVGYWAVAPLSCSASEIGGGLSSTVCSSIIGGPYVGSGLYNPPLEPAIGAGLELAAVAFVLSVVLVFWRGRAAAQA